MSQPNPPLTSSRSLAHNTLWNLIGYVAPLLIALFTIPPLIKGLGVDRFGVLALTWTVIGYFSLFDLGLGRALTQLVAEKLGGTQAAEIPAIAWTSLLLMVIFGLGGAGIVALLSPWLVNTALSIPDTLQAETLSSFYLLALSIPIVILTTGLRGLLEAHQYFNWVNILRIPMGILTFLGPLFVLPFSHSLVPIVAVLLLCRVGLLLAHIGLCFRIMPHLRNSAVQLKVIKPLFYFGGWMSVTNLIGPIMVYMDRFLISALLSVSAVAYYVTPYEMVTKLWLLPTALIGVLFPAFATTLSRERNRTVLLFNQGMKFVSLTLFPLVFIVVLFAYELMAGWLGHEFAHHSSQVLQWLAIGVLINSLAQLPFALIQAAGRPDLTAKLHLLELPVYLIGAWWLIGSMGILGAAVVWVMRITIDSLALFLILHRLIPETRHFFRSQLGVLLTLIVILAFTSTITLLPIKLALACIGIIAYLPLVYWRILAPFEREALLQYLCFGKKEA